MIRYVSLIVLASASGCMTGCTSGSKLPPAAEQALRDGSSFEFLSLDPDLRAYKTDEGFHGWNVLGTTAIKDSDTRTRLISRFKAGVAENSGMSAACFNPRHGIKVTHDGTTHEFVICFECYQVQWYIDGQKTEGFLITDSPQATFDKVLQESNVPLAEKPEH